MRLLLRILIVIPLGFVAACIAAAALLTFAAAPRPGSEQVIGAYLGVHAVVSLIFAAFIGFFAIVPATLAIVLAEIFRWRSPILHLIIGALIGFGLHLTGVSGEDYQGQLAAFAAAGAVGGGAYWLIAGRGAGSDELKAKAPERPSPS